MTTILHISGFVANHDDEDGPRPSGVKAAVHEGILADVANGVLDAIDHPMTVETIRDLNGWLREVRAYVDVNGEEMWHVFTTPSEQWPMATEEAKSDG